MSSITDSKLQALIERVKDATSKRGERIKLANHLGITPQHLRGWLSGERSPNGEATLQLLEWVATKEGKKQNALGRVISTPKDLTRSTPQLNEKRQTGPRKK